MHKLRLIFLKQIDTVASIDFFSHLLIQLHQLMLLSLKMNLSHACVNPSRMPETFQDHGCEALDVNDVYYTG